MNRKSLDDVISKVFDRLPDGAKNTKSNFEQALRKALQSVLAKMELVTREEFDAQVSVLHRCQAELADLKKALDAFEQSSRDK